MKLEPFQTFGSWCSSRHDGGPFGEAESQLVEGTSATGGAFDMFGLDATLRTMESLLFCSAEGRSHKNSCLTDRKLSSIESLQFDHRAQNYIKIQIPSNSKGILRVKTGPPRHDASLEGGVVIFCSV